MIEKIDSPRVAQLEACGRQIQASDAAHRVHQPTKQTKQTSRK